jgi:hypothetical protein
VTWKTRDTLPTYVLKIGTYFITYIALLLFQVIYHTGNEQTVNSYEPRREKNTISKGLEAITTYFKTKLTKIGNSIEQWNLNQTSKLRIQKKKRIATRMQTTTRRKGNYLFVALAAIAMEAREGSHDNTVTFDTDSSPVGVDNRCTGCISNRIEDFEGPLI